MKELPWSTKVSWATALPAWTRFGQSASVTQLRSTKQESSLAKKRRPARSFTTCTTPPTRSVAPERVGGRRSRNPHLDRDRARVDRVRPESLGPRSRREVVRPLDLAVVAVHVDAAARWEARLREIEAQGAGAGRREGRGPDQRAVGEPLQEPARLRPRFSGGEARQAGKPDRAGKAARDAVLDRRLLRPKARTRAAIRLAGDSRARPPSARRDRAAPRPEGAERRATDPRLRGGLRGSRRLKRRRADIDDRGPIVGGEDGRSAAARGRCGHDEAPPDADESPHSADDNAAPPAPMPGAARFP